MGFLDKAAAKVSEATKAAQDGIDEQQAKRKADGLLRELGAWTYAKHKGGFDEADENIARCSASWPPTRPSTASSGQEGGAAAAATPPPRPRPRRRAARPRGQRPPPAPPPPRAGRHRPGAARSAAAHPSHRLPSRPAAAGSAVPRPRPPPPPPPPGDPVLAASASRLSRP